MVEVDWEKNWLREQRRLADALGLEWTAWVHALVQAVGSPSLPAAVLGASAARKLPPKILTPSEREVLRVRLEGLRGSVEEAAPSLAQSVIDSAIARGGEGLRRSGALLNLKKAREAVKAPRRGEGWGGARSAGRATPDAPGEDT